jgi:AcrR family transcriptional regulator
MRENEARTDRPRRSSTNGRLREQRRASLGQPDIREVILQATERQLGESSLHELSVARIIEDAGVSRGSFYSYFESKQEVAAALLARVMEEMYELWLPYIERGEDDDPQAAFRAVLADAVRLWRDHRAVARVMHQYWDSVPEIGDQWLAAVERFTAGVAAELDRDRAARLAPEGRDSRTLAAAALWATEQILFVAGTDKSTDIPGADATFDILIALWSGLLYGRTR